MVRPLRIIEPGLWHQVTNRGRAGGSIFIDDRDREKFLSLLGECGSTMSLVIPPFPSPIFQAVEIRFCQRTTLSSTPQATKTTFFILASALN